MKKATKFKKKNVFSCMFSLSFSKFDNKDLQISLSQQ